MKSSSKGKVTVVGAGLLVVLLILASFLALNWVRSVAAPPSEKTVDVSGWLHTTESGWANNPSVTEWTLLAEIETKGYKKLTLDLRSFGDAGRFRIMWLLLLDPEPPYMIQDQVFNLDNAFPWCSTFDVIADKVEIWADIVPGGIDPINVWCRYYMTT